jgi:hypothetical protein
MNSRAILRKPYVYRSTIRDRVGKRLETSRDTNKFPQGSDFVLELRASPKISFGSLMRLQAIFIVFVVVLSTVACPAQQPPEPLGDVASRLRAERQNAPARQGTSDAANMPAVTGQPAAIAPFQSGTPAAPTDSVASVVGDPSKNRTDPLSEQNFETAIRELLDHEKFDELERAAALAWSSKARYLGGRWQLRDFYRAISSSSDRNATEASWSSKLKKLRWWASLKPNSATASIALANAYFEYAWKARGEGLANEVQEEQWKLFHERLNLAAAELEKASHLNPSPEWYRVMVQVMFLQGAPKSEVFAVLQQALALEPGYYHTYQAFANFLQPRWSGTEGEWEKFAAATSSRVGGKQGAAIYFFIAADLAPFYRQERFFAKTLILWTKIKEGFAASEELYGASNLTLNQFCYFAVKAEDATMAHKLFDRIGIDREEAVWDAAYFAKSKDWAAKGAAWEAANPTPSIADIERMIESNRATVEGLAYEQQINREFIARSADVVEQCLSSAPAQANPFDVMLLIGSNGRVESAMTVYPGAPPSCVVRRIMNNVFSPPPKPSYWIKITVSPQPPSPGRQAPVANYTGGWPGQAGGTWMRVPHSSALRGARVG